MGRLADDKMNEISELEMTNNPAVPAVKATISRLKAEVKSLDEKISKIEDKIDETREPKMRQLLDKRFGDEGIRALLYYRTEELREQYEAAKARIRERPDGDKILEKEFDDFWDNDPFHSPYAFDADYGDINSYVNTLDDLIPVNQETNPLRYTGQLFSVQIYLFSAYATAYRRIRIIEDGLNQPRLVS